MRPGRTITDGPNFSFSVLAAIQLIATNGSNPVPETRSENQSESKPNSSNEVVSFPRVFGSVALDLVPNPNPIRIFMFTPIPLKKA